MAEPKQNPIAALVNGTLLRWALGELLGALPVRRDWFNPDAEKVLREAHASPATAIEAAMKAAGNLTTSETDREAALRFKREADALWKRLNAAEVNAGRYIVWRDHMLTVDQAFMQRMEAALPPDVGVKRSPTADEWDAAIDKASGKPHAAAHPEALTVADYEEALESHRALVRQLDVLLNGDGAAKQASLADIVAQVQREGVRCGLADAIDALPRHTYASIANGMVGKYADDTRTDYLKLDDVRNLTGRPA